MRPPNACAPEIEQHDLCHTWCVGSAVHRGEGARCGGALCAWSEHDLRVKEPWEVAMEREGAPASSSEEERTEASCGVGRGGEGEEEGRRSRSRRRV